MTTSVMNMLDPQFLMGVLEERQDFGMERAKYIGSRFLPSQDVPEQTVLWETVRRENRLAGVYSSKAKAIPGDEIGFETKFANLVWIKAAKTLDPDLVMKIRHPGNIPVYKAGMESPIAQSAANEVQRKMTEYLTFIDDQMAAQKEYFALGAMMGRLVWPPRKEDGTPITIPMPEWNADEKIDIQWPFTTKFVQSINTLKGVAAKTGLAERSGAGYYWNNLSNADPRKDLEVIADMMLELKGVDAEGATIIMSRKVLSYLAETTVVQRWAVGTNYEAAGASAYANLNKVKDFFQTAFGYNVMLYDAKWSYLDGVDSAGKEIIRSVRFLPADKIIVIPAGERVGIMAQAPQEMQNGGYTTGQTLYVKRQDTPPYEREMGVSQVCFPILQDPEAIGLFTVLG